MTATPITKDDSQTILHEHVSELRSKTMKRLAQGAEQGCVEMGLLRVVADCTTTLAALEESDE